MADFRTDALSVYERAAWSRSRRATVAARAVVDAEIDALRVALTRAEVELRIRKRAMEQWPLCPDHRDKFDGSRCVACEQERAEAERDKLREQLRKAERRIFVYEDCDPTLEDVWEHVEMKELENDDPSKRDTDRD